MYRQNTMNTVAGTRAFADGAEQVARDLQRVGDSAEELRDAVKRIWAVLRPVVNWFQAAPTARPGAVIEMPGSRQVR